MTYARFRKPITTASGKLARVDVLLIDDWGLAPLADQERRDLLEVFEDQLES